MRCGIGWPRRDCIGYLPTLRLVTNLDIDDDGIARTVAAFARFFEQGGGCRAAQSSVLPGNTSFSTG